MTDILDTPTGWVKRRRSRAPRQSAVESIAACTPGGLGHRPRRVRRLESRAAAENAEARRRVARAGPVV